ncbi:MAG: Fic family protein [Spirochaetaceae bacterium]|nr:Fic family protein [Spirochaetaceae bacterium]
MARHLEEASLRAIEEVLRQHPDGRTASQIAGALTSAPPRRTLQYRLKSLVDSKRLIMDGKGRSARYHVPRMVDIAVHAVSGSPTVNIKVEAVTVLSEAGVEVREYVRQPPAARRPVGYDRAFLDSYRPNETFYFSPAERAHLHEVGRPVTAGQPAGTYARQILNRLLIDLSWNSSRLEGNTYSLLDTKRLLEIGEEAEGKQRLEAQMILNHKDAIEFLVDEAGRIGFDRHTILSLHALLADNLLADSRAAGRLRHIAVGIDGSVFYPLETPALIEECFGQVLATAAAIREPFEQALFVMVQLPYLQPFDDVNKRVSRLAANIPLIKANLVPLSFEDVPRDLYTEAILGVYELKRFELLRDVFIWAYGRSAARYAAVRQSLGEPDPFRLQHRSALREVIGTVIRERMNTKQASAWVAVWTHDHIEQQQRERFREVAERELLSLHEGNFARYRVRPSEFEAWQEVWTGS